MGLYRKIEVCIWNDSLFREFPDHTKLLFLFILTHPQMMNIGAMRQTKEGMARELNWRFGDMTVRFGQLVKHKRIEYDERATLIAVPNFLKYNGPTSPNHVKSWGHALSLLPECKLRVKVQERMLAVLNGKWAGGKPSFWYAYSDGISDAMRDAIGDAMPDGMSDQRARERVEIESERESESKATLAAWNELWEGKYGQKLVTPKAKVMTELRRVSKELGVTPLIVRMERCINAGDDYMVSNNHPLALFLSQVDKYAVERKVSKGKKMDALEQGSKAALARRGFTS